MRTQQVLPSKLAVAAFLVFGGLCLEVGLLIGSELCRVQCVGSSNSNSRRGLDHDVVVVVAAEAAEAAAAMGGAIGTPDIAVRNDSAVARELDLQPRPPPRRRKALERGSSRLRSNGDQRKEAALVEAGALKNGAAPGAAVAGTPVHDQYRMLGPSNLLAGAVRVKRKDFAEAVDVGVPIDVTDEQMDDVLLLYTSNSSLPGEGAPGAGSAERAVENCLSLKVVLIDKDVDSNCIAVVGHPVESYHVHRFHRMPNFEHKRGAQKLEASKDVPLRLVQRAVETDGNVRAREDPTGDDVDAALEELGRYLTQLNDTLRALRPVAEAAAGEGRTVVAMTVNEGQAELFVNFLCAARSRGLDLSHLVLFATDDASYKLGKSTGVHTFEVRGAFGPMPTKAADF
jgi:hypothetical protein